jgi:glycosyltransferase involved in cell wall biosynthesis
MNNRRSVELSVVIPVLDGENLISDQLHALSLQQCDVSWEVIVADNGSTDSTVSRALSFRDALPQLQIVHADVRGKATALNAGVAAASGELILCLDQDDVVDAGYVEAVRHALNGADLAGGSFEHQLLNPPWAIVSEEQVDSLPRSAGRTYSLGAGLSFRRGVHQALSGFATDVGVGDDVDFCWRAGDAGYALVFVPSALLHYRHRTRLSETWRQGLGYGRGDALLRRKHGLGAARWREHADRLRKIGGHSFHMANPLYRYRAAFHSGILVGRLRTEGMYFLPRQPLRSKSPQSGIRSPDTLPRQ